MKKWFLSGSLVVLLLSCNKNDQFSKTQSTATSAVLRNQASALRLETFSAPETIEGCSCVFARTKEDFDNEKFVYADDFGKSAFIKIDGEIVKVPLKETDFDPNQFDKTITNGKYTIHLKGKKVQELDETFRIEGTISVQDNEGKTATTNIYGECGC